MKKGETFTSMKANCLHYSNQDNKVFSHGFKKIGLAK